MNTYSWLLLGQTLLALLSLGLAGGWTLLPFRRDERPNLWLATPLAGLLVVGGSITVLYFFVGLPFRWCTWAGLAANAVATAVCLVRARPVLPSYDRSAVAVVVLLAASCWATVSCNKTAIDAREPTIVSMDGSDMFGYAITANWLKAHGASQRPRPDELYEIMPHGNLYRDGGRPLAHVLTAAAAEVRGTTPLFSYDWASGVILSAGLLAFGGVFASNSLLLILLVSGAGTSNWLANARTGYLGRSISYPGTMLLAGLLLSTASAFTWRRLAVLAVLGAAVGFSFAPVFPAAVLGMITACLVGSLALAYPIDRICGTTVPQSEGEVGTTASRIETGSVKARVLKPMLIAVIAYAVTVGPAFTFYYASRESITAGAGKARGLAWSFVIPVALDLEPPTLPLLTPLSEKWLLYACATLYLVLAGTAVAARRPAALALIGFGVVVPVSWLLEKKTLYHLAGVVYPLTLAGAAVLAAPATSRRSIGRTAILAILLVGVVGIRVPQARATANRYYYSDYPYRAIIRQSEVRAIREGIGNDAVDVALGHYADNHMVLAELVSQNIAIRLRSPGWERSLKNWVPEDISCAKPDLLGPKSRFSLMERNAYAPPGTERYVGERYKLIEDRDSITILGVEGSQEMVWDREWRPGVWIGNMPTTFLVHNGTGQPQSVRLLGDTSAGPANPDRDRRTLRYRLASQTGTLSVPKENKAAMTLHLAPGLNRVELAIDEAPDPIPPPKRPVPMLAFSNWRVEPAEAP